MSDTHLVMIVEDDDTIRGLVAQYLELNDFSVLEAENGKVALELLLGATQVPELIILDLMMPVMTGWEFLREQEHHERISKIPVVILTGVGSRADLPVIEILQKPCDLKALLKTVQNHCS